jgi:hypothetical protein
MVGRKAGELALYWCGGLEAESKAGGEEGCEIDMGGEEVSG